jgi:hypothetical protein
MSGILGSTGGIAGSAPGSQPVAVGVVPGAFAVPPPLHGNQMRTYGRVVDPSGAKFWVEVGPDVSGYLDSIYLTALAQTLKLNLQESPFYADWGIPARASIQTQVPPDYYVALTQQRYSPRFMALLVTRDASSTTPTYNIAVQFSSGAQYSVTEVPRAFVDNFGLPINDQYGNPLAQGSKQGIFAPT